MMLAPKKWREDPVEDIRAIFFTGGSMGRKHSKATRLKMSLASRGKKNPFFGRHHTREVLKKIKRASQGSNNPMYGRRHTAETKKKISVAMRRVRLGKLQARQK